MSTVRQEERPQAEKKTLPDLNLGLQASKTMRDKFRLFKPPVYGVLIWQSEQTNAKPYHPLS